MSTSTVLISPFSPFTKYQPIISFLSFQSCFAIANIFLRPSAVFRFSHHSSNALLVSFFLALYILLSSGVPPYFIRFFLSILLPLELRHTTTMSPSFSLYCHLFLLQLRIELLPHMFLFQLPSSLYPDNLCICVISTA